jgi:hypothetical protein
MRKKLFTNYKSLEAYLRGVASRDFFITCTKGNAVVIVISINNQLVVRTNKIGRWAWLSQQEVTEMIAFINQ